jgi:hypothetical protein
MMRLDAAASGEAQRGLSFLLGLYLTGQPRLKHMQVWPVTLVGSQTQQGTKPGQRFAQ